MYQLGERIREERIKNNYTQNQLAEMLGIKSGTFSRYETNEIEPRVTNLCKIAAALHVSVDYLCGMESSGTMSMVGLTNEQTKIIQELKTAFLNHNSSIKKKLSTEQYEILGQIVAEFSKK